MAWHGMARRGRGRGPGEGRGRTVALGVDVSLDIGQMIPLHRALAPAELGQGALEVLRLHGAFALAVYFVQRAREVLGAKEHAVWVVWVNGREVWAVWVNQEWCGFYGGRGVFPGRPTHNMKPHLGGQATRRGVSYGLYG